MKLFQALAANDGMKSSVQLKKDTKRATPRGNERRRLILDSLHDCIIEKGYAKTSLRDVAEKAGLYPSHILYYFEGKEAIMQEYFKKMSNRIVKNLAEYRSESPERQIDLLVELFFSGKGIDKSEVGFMLECFGVAVNDPVMRAEKAKVDKTCKIYLTALFERTPLGFMSNARDSAEVAYSLLIGLRTAVYFDESLRLTKARGIFKESMYRFTNLGDS